MSDPINELPKLVEAPTAEPIKRKPKGWPKGKSRKKPTPATEFKAPAEFAGLTENSCCDACTPSACVISGFNICGHPFKTPVNVIIAKPAAVDRYQRAKKSLEHLVMDLRGKSFGQR